MNIGEWLRHASDVLEESGSPDPQIDAKWIAEDTLGLTRAELHFESTRGIDAAQLEQLDERLMRRAEGEPVQYILHSAYFMGLKFYVDDRVLIPRQDTETLVEAVIVALHELESPDVLDLCAGSGAIGLSVKTLIPSANVTLTDISRDALDVARRNAHELNAEVDIRHGDLFRAVGRDRFDLIASNPPYIPHGDHRRPAARGAPRAGARAGRRLGRPGRLPAHRLRGGRAPQSRRLPLPRGRHRRGGARAGAGDRGRRCARSPASFDDLNGIPRVVWARSV